MEAIGRFYNYITGGIKAPESPTQEQADSQVKVNAAAAGILAGAAESQASEAAPLQTKDVVNEQKEHPLKTLDPQLFNWINTAALQSTITVKNKEFGKLACLVLYAQKNFGGKALLVAVQNKDGRKKLTVIIEDGKKYRNIISAIGITVSDPFKANRAEIVEAYALDSARLDGLELGLQKAYDALSK
ncbi:MAG: hypothetical protein SP4CHLAM5_00700 [Chlamydiia bacterium]|nr:hypothetical protein [Chlamydiia bacterium]MCH9617947.1 hypothetical protein [Chlamydiia bacterium]